jgi:hypothetical protein
MKEKLLMKSTFPLALGVLLITSGAAFAMDAIPTDAASSAPQIAPAASSSSVFSQQTQAPKDAATSHTTTTTSESATTNGDTQKTDATQVKTSEYQSKTSPVVESSTTGATETTTSTTGSVAPANNVQKLFKFLQHSNTQSQAGATPEKSVSPSTTGTTTTP